MNCHLTNQSFREKVLIQPLNNEVFKPKPGHTYLQQVKGKNKVIVIKGPTTIRDPPEKKHKVLNLLVELDRKRKQRYLDTWGEYEYEKEFPKYEPIYNSSDDESSVNSDSENSSIYDYDITEIPFEK